MPRIQFGNWVEDAVDWLQSHLTWVFDVVQALLGGMYDGVDACSVAASPS